MISNWNDNLKRIAREKDFLKQNRGIMSPFEREQQERKIQELNDSFSGGIERGMVEMMLESANKVKTSESVLKSYERKEAEGWDANKQMVAYQGIENRLSEAAADKITGGKRAKDIFEDALNSKYAMLAFSEIAPKYARRNGDVQLNSLAVQAAREVKKMRETPEIAERRNRLNESIVNFGETLKAAERVHRTLYDADIDNPLITDALARATKRFIWQENGELEILPEDDGRVTGVYYREVTQEMAGQ
jgi:hypothetical protein